jgi:hypothetical protein
MTVDLGDAPRFQSVTPGPFAADTESRIGAISRGESTPEDAAWVRSLCEYRDPDGARNDALAAALALWPDLKLTPACDKLAAALDCYITGGAWLKRERHLSTLSGASELRQLLHRIARLTGGDGSIGARQIFNLMKKRAVEIS